MTTLGFLGLGTMGSGMARRLVDAGHEVLVWNRSQDPVDRLVEAGAQRAAQPSDALSAPVSFSMLANDQAVESVLNEEALAAARGNIHVLMASISPSLADRTTARLTEAGVVHVAAPVLGRPHVAAAGQLNILAAGPSDAIDQVEPFLAAMGKRTWRLGERPSIANAVKVAVNYNLIHTLQALGETIAMTERLGVEPTLFTELLSNTLFGGVAYTGYGQLIATREYTPPGFSMALGRKDLALAEEVASSTGVVPATLPALISVFEQALADPELREYDWSAVAEITRRA